jgi:hypothetical protein
MDRPRKFIFATWRLPRSGQRNLACPGISRSSSSFSPFLDLNRHSSIPVHLLTIVLHHIFKLERYLKRKFVAHSKTFCFLVDRVSDFHALRSLYLKHLSTPRLAHWKRAFNLRLELHRAYGSNIHPGGIEDMMDLLRLERKPSFSALDECISLSHVILHMIRDGYSFTNPEMVSEQLRSPSTMWEIGPDSLWIFGLSWDIQADDVILFFNVCSIPHGGVVICLSQEGKPSGHAIVKFESAVDVASAMMRDGDTLGSTPVRIRHTCRGDFDKTLSRQSAIRRRVFGNPRNVGDSNGKGIGTPLLDYPASGATSMPSSSHWSGALQTVYQPTSHVFTSLLSGSTCDTPASRSHTPVRSASSAIAMQVDYPQLPPIFSQPSSLKPLGNATATGIRLNRDVLVDMCTRFPEGTVVSMRGLPYSVSEAQISEFFSTYDLSPSSLVLTTTEDGRPSGDGFVAFINAEQASQAVRAQSGKYIGARYVELSVVN